MLAKVLLGIVNTRLADKVLAACFVGVFAAVRARVHEPGVLLFHAVGARVRVQRHVLVKLLVVLGAEQGRGGEVPDRVRAAGDGVLVRGTAAGFGEGVGDGVVGS